MNINRKKLLKVYGRLFVSRRGNLLKRRKMSGGNEITSNVRRSLRGQQDSSGIESQSVQLHNVRNGSENRTMRQTRSSYRGSATGEQTRRQLRSLENHDDGDKESSDRYSEGDDGGSGSTMRTQPRYFDNLNNSTCEEGDFNPVNGSQNSEGTGSFMTSEENNSNDIGMGIGVINEKEMRIDTGADIFAQTRGLVQMPPLREQGHGGDGGSYMYVQGVGGIGAGDHSSISSGSAVGERQKYSGRHNSRTGGDRQGKGRRMQSLVVDDRMEQSSYDSDISGSSASYEMGMLMSGTVEKINSTTESSVKKATRMKLFPYMKFVTNLNSFERPNLTLNGQCPYKIIGDALMWGAGKERAVKWNTYNKCVRQTIQSNRSTVISHVKRNMMEGELYSFYGCKQY